METLRRRIAAGEFAVGQFLPSQRELIKDSGLAQNTVRRALKKLEKSGLVQAEHGKGYRVLSRINDPTFGHPLAFIDSEQKDNADWTGFNRILLDSVHKAAHGRGWSVLAVGAENRSADEVIEQCRGANAWGAVLVTPDAQFVSAANKAGLSVVLMDDWHVDVQVDTVLQDGFRGGFLAARHLLAMGHRKIAWFGSRLDSIHHMFRYGGAQAALQQAGVKPAANWATIAPVDAMAAAMRERLSRSDRPTAVLALWFDLTTIAGEVARELGLVLGRDLDVVGWCSKPRYERDLAAHFADGRLPAMIVWDPEEMAETALTRLVARREHPLLPTLQNEIPVQLLV